MTGFASDAYGESPYGESGSTHAAPAEAQEAAEHLKAALLPAASELAVSGNEHVKAAEYDVPARREGSEHSKVAYSTVVPSDARVSREHAEALITLVPETQVSREHVETLIALVPDTRVTREHVEVLYLNEFQIDHAHEHAKVAGGWPGQIDNAAEHAKIAEYDDPQRQAAGDHAKVAGQDASTRQAGADHAKVATKEAQSRFAAGLQTKIAGLITDAMLRLPATQNLKTAIGANALPAISVEEHAKVVGSWIDQYDNAAEHAKVSVQFTSVTAETSHHLKASHAGDGGDRAATAGHVKVLPVLPVEQEQVAVTLAKVATNNLSVVVSTVEHMKVAVIAPSNRHGWGILL